MVTTLFLNILKRDLLLARRSGGDTLGAALFFLICGCLFPLALGPSPLWLHQTGPGIMWVCALLASILPLDKLFTADFEDGSLDQLMMSALPSSFIALSKMTTHWLTSALPVLLGSIILGLMYHLTIREITITLGSLTLGTLTFSLIGGMVAATTLGARHTGVLLPLLTLPLATPPLIFGAATSYAEQLGTPLTAGLCLLGGFFCACLPLCPLAAGVGLREACR